MTCILPCTGLSIFWVVRNLDLLRTIVSIWQLCAITHTEACLFSELCAILILLRTTAQHGSCAPSRFCLDLLFNIASACTKPLSLSLSYVSWHTPLFLSLISVDTHTQRLVHFLSCAWSRFCLEILFNMVSACAKPLFLPLTSVDQWRKINILLCLVARHADYLSFITHFSARGFCSCFCWAKYGISCGSLYAWLYWYYFDYLLILAWSMH